MDSPDTGPSLKHHTQVAETWSIESTSQLLRESTDQL